MVLCCECFVLISKMEIRIHYICFITFWIITKASCQLHVNTPPIMTFERNWVIPETEEVGSVITRVGARDNDADFLIYGIEPISFGDGPPRPLPFRINNATGVVYLNESLKGRAGENINLYVTAFNGDLPVKTEVWVKIVGSNSRSKASLKTNLNPFSNTNNRFPPSLLSFTNFNSGQPPASIANNPRPFPGQMSYFPLPTNKPNKTRLLPAQEKQNEADTADNSSIEAELTTLTKETTTKRYTYETNHINTPIDQPVKSVPDLTITLVPIVSVVAIFLGVGIIALLFRKKICMGRIKESKDDMRKESSGAVVLQDDPSLTMQYWRGPRAFSNRYVPWEREAAHPQISLQSSAPPKVLDKWEFPRHHLKVFNILGEGAFGQVWKCEALDINAKEGVSIVAVKTLKENATEKERQDLLSELQVMKMLDVHPNVVKLLGCCTEKDPVFVIMEFISKGKLQSFLRNSRAERNYNNMHGQSKTLTSRDLTSFVYQVAKGMEFLSANGIIHRDLAARNILITEDHVCKVADFGFARDVIDSHVYERKSEGRLPIRWMAPESLYDNIFTVKSDVWSFGVLIWEVVTLGSTPYTGLSAAEVMKRVRDGYRLEKPEHCRRELYNIMYYCWDKDPKQRPSFEECVELLEKLIISETDYIELERFPDHSYYNMTSLSGEKL
ncbi:tyrosine kinase receptor Cad96Ca-like isoform X1 [Photinus pyralis]|nr:tyrosine kinase receptor Cad96Ca-like isoform X1 [Photinus pyralis]